MGAKAPGGAIAPGSKKGGVKFAPPKMGGKSPRENFVSFGQL